MTKYADQLRRGQALADELCNHKFIVHPPSVGIDANWHVCNDTDTVVAHCFGFGHSVEQGQALAVRVAAALNYCRGLPTADLLAADQAGHADIR